MNYLHIQRDKVVVVIVVVEVVEDNFIIPVGQLGLRTKALVTVHQIK